MLGWPKKNEVLKLFLSACDDEPALLCCTECFYSNRPHVFRSNSQDETLITESPTRFRNYDFNPMVR